MSRASTLARARRAAEAGMNDACTITKPGEGDPVRDTATGQYVDPPRVTVYSGKCRVQIPGQIANSSTAEAGEHDWTTSAAIVQLPVVGSEDVRVGHIIKIDAAEHDANLVGREYLVVGPHHKSEASSRRLRCEEVVA